MSARVAPRRTAYQFEGKIVTVRSTVLVAMPGAGFDDDYAARAFGPAGAALEIPVVSVMPDPADWVNGFTHALDEAAAGADTVLAAGISIGGCAAVRWALAHPNRCTGVWAALPPWSGNPAAAPASYSAQLTADGLLEDGLTETITRMRVSSPSWLATELDRSWRHIAGTATGFDSGAHGLARLLTQVASFHAPTPDDVARLTVPLAVTVATDDPIHPAAVGRSWAAAAHPAAPVAETTLDAIGADPAELGNRCLAAWRLRVEQGG